jgi:hypothetical protein
MNLLRATVSRTEEGWWELQLLDLDVVADGDSEDAMLRDLEHSLTAEYHLAVRNGETPFVRLFKGCPAEVSRAWQEDHKQFRSLNLTDEVKRALAAVFRSPVMNEFRVTEDAA